MVNASPADIIFSTLFNRPGSSFKSPKSKEESNSKLKVVYSVPCKSGSYSASKAQTDRPGFKIFSGNDVSVYDGQSLNFKGAETSTRARGEL